MAGDPPTWRPVQSIRVVAIALAIQDGRILVVEVLADNGAVKGWRPPGGGVEFGELATEALTRELQEEMGCEVKITGVPIVCENLYVHEGITGHEIIFAYPVTLSDPAIYERQRFQILEDTGSAHWVQWISLADFAEKKAALFPTSLQPHLLALP